MTIDRATLDEARLEAFAGRLLSSYTESMVTLMIDVGLRTGLLDTLAADSGTSAEVAERAGLVERYVRECLGALVTAGIVEYDPATGRYTLPPEHAACLSGPGTLNLAPISQLTTLLAKHVDGVAHAFREGGGVPYDAFRPEFTRVMDGLSRGLMDEQLIDGILPVTGDLPARLAAGVPAADIGCGTGHAVNLLARAYPRSRFTGYDIAADAITVARAEAADWGLTNASFEIRDATTLPTEPPLAAVFAFDAIHDQVDPARILARIHEALRARRGVRHVRHQGRQRRRGQHRQPPRALAVRGEHTALPDRVPGPRRHRARDDVGEQLARRMLTDAGFVNVTVHDVPDDPFDTIYLAHKPAGHPPQTPPQR